MSQRSLVSAKICWNNRQVAFTAARSCFFWYLRRRLWIGPWARQMRWMALWLGANWNSRFSQAAPKVGNWRRLVRAVVMSAAALQEAGRPLLLVAAQPLAHGGHGGLEQPGRGLDPVLAGMDYQAQAMVIRVLHLADQIEVGSRTGHGPPILRRRAELALPPASSPSLPSDTHSGTSTSQEGYDEPFLFHLTARLDRRRCILL